MIPISERSWIEQQVANLYGINSDSAYIDPSGKSGFYFNSQAPSLLGGEGDETRGYFFVNTGNRVFDAIATVAANEVGIDNAYKSFKNFQSGNYASGFKEAAFALGELGLVAFPFGKAAKVGLGGLPAVFRGAFKPAKMRYNWKTGTSSVVNPGGIATRAGRTARNVPSIVAADAKKFGAFGPAVSAGRGGLAALRLALPKGARLRRLGAVGGLASLAGLAMSRDPNASLAGEAETGTTKTSPPALVPRGSATSPEDAANNARVNIAGINQQYNNILRELRGMYQLSQTDEERERLRFMLADIEAQKDAGLQAIAEGYSQTVAQIQQQATLAGERTTERSQRYGGELEASADRAAQRMMLQNLEQQQQFRGLGSGSQAPVNEWVGLMSAMAPAQQLYTQRMGDISREGMEWLAQTVGAQGQAQGADLQRLAGATRSGAIARQQAEVSERINRERELQRAAILQTMQQQASAVQSANQFNAGDGGSVTPLSRTNTIEQLAGRGYTVPGILQYFESGNLGALDPSEQALAEIAVTVPRT
jgi:hypothetical protein